MAGSARIEISRVGAAARPAMRPPGCAARLEIVSAHSGQWRIEHHPMRDRVEGNEVHNGCSELDHAAVVETQRRHLVNDPGGFCSRLARVA